MAQEHFYDVNVNWDKERIGTLSSKVLNNSIEVATPPEFAKGNCRYLVARTFTGSCSKQLPDDDYFSGHCPKIQGLNFQHSAQLQLASLKSI